MWCVAVEIYAWWVGGGSVVNERVQIPNAVCALYLLHDLKMVVWGNQ